MDIIKCYVWVQNHNNMNTGLADTLVSIKQSWMFYLRNRLHLIAKMSTKKIMADSVLIRLALYSILGVLFSGGFRKLCAYIVKGAGWGGDLRAYMKKEKRNR